jgi:hypothetical protein
MSRKLVDQEWDDMITAHRETQRQLEKSDEFLGQIVEGLRFDIDILRHAFSRWVAQIDERSTRHG